MCRRKGHNKCHSLTRCRDQRRYRGRIVIAANGDDRAVAKLFPIEQERIGRDGNHVADLGAVVHGDDAVVFHQGCAGIAAFLWVGINGIGQISPMDQIITDGMSPMLTRIFGRVGLVKQMPASLPEADTVGVVQRAFRIDIMIEWSVRILRETLPRFAKALQEWIDSELLALRIQGLGEFILWNK